MSTEQIKGCCEYCDFCYVGSIKLVEAPAVNPTIDKPTTLVYTRIKCPHCGKETMNYDTASAVETLDKAENRNCEYTESQFEIISDPVKFRR